MPKRKKIVLLNEYFQIPFYNHGTGHFYFWLKAPYAVGMWNVEYMTDGIRIRMTKEKGDGDGEFHGVSHKP